MHFANITHLSLQKLLFIQLATPQPGSQRDHMSGKQSLDAALRNLPGLLLLRLHPEVSGKASAACAAQILPKK